LKTKKINNLAPVGLFFGILSVVCCCLPPLFPVLGVVFSSIAIARINKNPEHETGKTMAVFGILFSLLGVFMLIFLVIYLVVSEWDQLRDAPDFYERQAEYTRANWIGGGWGWVDPVKEVEASRKAIDYGLSTLAKEVAAQGDDWEENLDQLSREREAIDQRGLDIYHSAQGGAQGNDNGSPPDESE